MNDQLARSLFMDYLYDEISTEEKQKLEKYLEANPELWQELHELQETRSLLQKMPEKVPDQKLLMVESENRSLIQWWQQAKTLLPNSVIGKSAFATAAGLILFLIIGSVLQLHFDTGGEGITIRFGHAPGVNEELTAQQAEALANQIREENAAMLADFAEEINRQNEEQLQQVVNYFQEQRMNDLQLVNQAIDELQQNTNYQLYQTNEYLSEVLQTVSYQNQN